MSHSIVSFMSMINEYGFAEYSAFTSMLIAFSIFGL